jgi:alpha-tubulin suppressor-like RCC1 family protein
MYSIINTPAKELPNSLPYIDVTLVLDTIKARWQIPLDITSLILHVYFRVIRPTVACANDHVVIGGYNTVTEYTRITGSFERTALHGDLIACGSKFTIISSGSHCYARGVNYLGQLGLGDCHQSDSFIAIPLRDLSLYLLDGRSIIKPMGVWNAIAISCGTDHTFMISHVSARGCASTESGTIIRTIAYSWGSNTHGKLGISIGRDVYRGYPTPVAVINPTAIACSDDYTLILANELVYFCGLSRENVQIPLCQIMVGFQIVAINACCNRYTVYTSGGQALNSFGDLRIDLLGQEIEDKFAWFISARAKMPSSAFPTCTAHGILSRADLTIMLGTPIDIVASGEIVIVTTTRGLYMFLQELVTGTHTTRSSLLTLF